MTDAFSPPDPPPQPTSAPPGWYPTSPGMQGYWDGTRWTGDVAPLMAAPTKSSDDTTMAMLAHLLGIFTWFIGPLVLYLVKKDESPFVRHHAAEALNFQITVAFAMIASVFLILVVVGILMLIFIPIGALVLEIVAAVRAYNGDWYRYPVNIRLVS